MLLQAAVKYSYIFYEQSLLESEYNLEMHVGLYFKPFSISSFCMNFNEKWSWKIYHQLRCKIILLLGWKRNNIWVQTTKRKFTSCNSCKKCERERVSLGNKWVFENFYNITKQKHRNKEKLIFYLIVNFSSKIVAQQNIF